MHANNQHIPILFRSISFFLFLGSMLVPVAITLDVRAAIMAPFALFFGWHWGVMAGTIFGVALIFSVKHFPILSSCIERRHWLLIGLLLGLLAGFLVAVVAGIDMLRDMASVPSSPKKLIHIFLGMIIIPSAICGCLCAGIVLYPNNLNIQSSSPKMVGAWLDVMLTLTVAYLLIIKFAALMHKK